MRVASGDLCAYGAKTPTEPAGEKPPDKSAVCPQTAMLAGIEQARPSCRDAPFSHRLKMNAIFVLIVIHTAAAERAAVLAILLRVFTLQLQLVTVSADLAGIAAYLAQTEALFGSGGQGNVVLVIDATLVPQNSPSKCWPWLVLLPRTSH